MDVKQDSRDLKDSQDFKTETETVTVTVTETETGSMIEMAEQDCYLVPRLLIFVQGGVGVRKEIVANCLIF